MKDFIKFMFASMVGFILANIVIGILSFIAVAAIVGSMMTFTKKFETGSEVKIKENTILKIDLANPIVEQPQDNPFAELGSIFGEAPTPVSLRDVIRSIEMAADDDKITGIYLRTDYSTSSFATMKEIRDALKSFKESGKFIYAYGDIISQGAYYVSSLSDSVYMHPEGIMNFAGLNSEKVFIRGMFDKLGVTTDIVRTGKFKSAGEMFSEKEMSEANEEQSRRLLETVYDHFIKELSESRGISMEDLKAIASELKIRTPEGAVEYKFVDRLAYKDQVVKSLIAASKVDDDYPRLVDLTKYKSKLKSEKKQEKNVGIIYANGPIEMGEGDYENIGSEGLSKTIRKARKDSTIKAIVLRVNSPGGSALASDIIWREVMLAKKAKPVIVSMGNVAASGGYYIAAPADAIVAQPNTITGSIGVIGILMNWQEFWNDKMGVTFDRVKTGPYADLGNPNRPIRPEERAIIQGYINDTYDEFIGKVADGRNMEKNMVDSIAQGRVWSGIDAKQIGLVDELGGIETAIDLAADKAGLEEYGIKNVITYEDPFKKFLKEFGANTRKSVIKSFLSDEEYQIIETSRKAKEMNGIYSIMPDLFFIN